MQNVHDADTEASHPTPLRAAPRDRPAARPTAHSSSGSSPPWAPGTVPFRRDDCSAWCVSGKTGSIHTWGDSATWAVFVTCRSASCTGRLRSSVSRSAPSPRTATTRAACALHQPAHPDQAAASGTLCGIQKRREVSAETLERLKAFAFASGPRSEASK